MPPLQRFDLTRARLSEDQLREIADRLREGALIIYPTDTLYAIGCLALDPVAVARLREAKGREADKPLPVIAADIAQARSLAARWPDAAERLAAAFWPGPLTLVVPAAPMLGAGLLASARSIAVRVPNSEVARALAQAAGPLVSTSANLASEPPCLDVGSALRAFPLATLAIDLGLLEGAPSTIVGFSQVDDIPHVLRAGRLSARDVMAVFRRAGPP